jgi:hypothetical protein
MQPLDQDDEEVIWQLRNALLHSFGLYSEGRNRKYNFVILGSTAELVSRYPPHPDVYGIGVYTLRDRFETSIARYRYDLELEHNTALQDRFDTMHCRYGEIIRISTLGAEQPPGAGRG